MPPRPDDDSRFTMGLVYDVAGVLEGHGYPTATGFELMRVQEALFALLYDETTLGTRTADSD